MRGSRARVPLIASRASWPPTLSAGSMPRMGENGAHGAVRVANEVIASIAALAACEVEGVAGMDETSARHFGGWGRPQTAHRGAPVQAEAERATDPQAMNP